MVCIVLIGQAQIDHTGNHNFRSFQQKAIYFGITLGFNSSNFQIHHSKNFILNDTFAVAEAKPGPGFNVSLVANMKMGENFDFRFLPGFSFAERSIVFNENNIDKTLSTTTIESVFIQLPFHVRYKSAPYKDKRVFAIAGIKYTYDVASNSRVRKEKSQNLIKISPHDFAFEIGAGIQFFLPLFIFSPEIKFSQGLSNILIYNGALERSKVLETLNSRTFTISLHFEG
ncbi:MAG: PorT family protein [Bacteroidetes bacterium]|nr:MAG: PorT family protein [Bacteroidota bacterium]